MLFATPTLFGAILLFVVEPMFAKWLLPTLGGTPSTWASCLLAFQVLLLAGYGYAHFFVRWPPRAQGVLHAALLAAAAAFAFHTRAFGVPALAPIRAELAVPWLVVSRIGAPYVVLASTAPLMQRWFGRSTGRNPYTLYALSNAGALLGLLAYPFAVEPRLEVPRQLEAWSVAFVAFAALTIPACPSRATRSRYTS